MTTQRKEELVISREARGSTGAVQWFLEFPDDPDIFQTNNLEVLICGQESFGRIAEDIRAAKKSIDLICWGFDPAMELERTGYSWPRGETYGDLLAAAAERGVKVRLLCWHDTIGSYVQNNMPGSSSKGSAIMRKDNIIFKRSIDYLYTGPQFNNGFANPNLHEGARDNYNYYWYKDAFSGQHGVEVRTRNGDSSSVKKSIGEEKGLAMIERFGLEHMATHHQKTILIDYEGEKPVGYVMGLNSVTDYWDTERHLFNDPLRGEGWEGTGRDNSVSNLQPFQDYVCRIEGEALVDLQKNFISAWGRAKPRGKAVPPSVNSVAEETITARQRLSKTVKEKPQRIQMVRTQPEENEFRIENLYQQATSFSRNYIYIENQYFQHAELVRHIKQTRKAFFEEWKNAAGASKQNLPDLHLIIVTPTPERKQMVPSTHDALTELGYGSSMPNQKQQALDYRDNAVSKKYPTLNRKFPGVIGQEARETSKTFFESGGDRDEEELRNELKEIFGLRALVVSMWTPSPYYKEKPREIYIHSKLMIIDDSLFTLGSANTNLRSMRVDSELNMVSDDPEKTKELRERVWTLMGGKDISGKTAKGDDMKEAFEKWQKKANDNLDLKEQDIKLKEFIVKFLDKRTSTWRLG